VDNTFFGWLWGTVKDENVYLKGYSFSRKRA
jgi:hypothetical protein